MEALPVQLDFAFQGRGELRYGLAFFLRCAYEQVARKRAGVELSQARACEAGEKQVEGRGAELLVRRAGERRGEGEDLLLAKKERWSAIKCEYHAGIMDTAERPPIRLGPDCPSNNDRPSSRPCPS